jgi:competence protein ComEC
VLHAGVDGGSARLDVRLVPAALTSWAVTAAGIWWSAGKVTALAALVLAASSGALWWHTQNRQRSPRIRTVSAGLLGVSVVGVGFGFAIALRAEAVDHHPITTAFGQIAPVTVTPSENAIAIGHGRLLFRAALHRLGDNEMSGRVIVFASARHYGEVMVGRPVRFTARISPPTRRDLTVAALNATGKATTGRAGPVHRVAHHLRDRFAALARDVLPAPQAAMLPALVLGDTSGVTPVTSQEFRVAGLTHLTAVSGANVTIVCGAVLFSARLIGPRSAVGLAALALVVFVIVVQPTASVLRAAVMGAITLLGMLSSRRRQAIPSLSATVLVLMVTAPQLAVDVGFALSVVATAALVVIAPAWSRRLVSRGWPKPLADAVCIACAAQVVTAPLVAGISGRVSVVAAAANLAAVPAIAPITVLGTAAAALGMCWPTAAQVLIRFTGPELWWVLSVAHRAARVPAASVPVPAGVSGIVVVCACTVLGVALWRWRWFRASAAVAVVCLLAWALSGLLPGASLSAGHDTIVG